MRMASRIPSAVVVALLATPLSAAAANGRNTKPRPRAEDVAAFLAQLRTTTDLTEQVSTRLGAATASALRDPAAYFRAHSDYFVQRTIEEPRSDIYIFVLLDGLCEAKIAGWLDWKTRWEDVLWSINRISREEGFTTAGLDPRTVDTETALSLIATQLLPRGRRLLQWEMDEDAYYVLVVKNASVADVIRAARRLDIEIKPVAMR
jgi:hypothetical protein